jgi:hypothetical protein
MKLKHKKNICIYCLDQKIHPAFQKEELCGTCASDCFEDYKERLTAYKQIKK